MYIYLFLQALLRMDKQLSKKRRLQRVEEVIHEVSFCLHVVWPMLFPLIFTDV